MSKDYKLVKMGNNKTDNICRTVTKQSLVHECINGKVSDWLPYDNYSLKYMRRLRVRRDINLPEEVERMPRSCRKDGVRWMFSRTSGLTRVRGTRSRNRSSSLPAMPFGVQSFLEILVNISVKGAAGELAGTANRNRSCLALSQKLLPRYTLGRA